MLAAVKTFLPMINKETGHYQLIYLSNWYGKGQLVTNEIDGGNRQVILGDVPTNIYGAFFSPRCPADGPFFLGRRHTGYQI